MTKFLTKSVLAASMLIFATPVLAAPAGKGSFKSKAKIVKPVTITWVRDLDFGSTTMNPALTSATVTVADSLNATAVCSSTELTCSGGSPALFNLSSGLQGQKVQITHDDPTTLLHTNGSNTVGFKLDNIEDVVLDATGAGSFYVGGTITVVAATIDGDYSATVNIVANYL